MYFIPICDDVKQPFQVYDLDPDCNCKDLFNTKFFKIAKFEDPLFLSYKTDELHKQVKGILQIQGYLLFQWCVIRRRIEHRLKYKKLHFSCSKVMPWNFYVTNTDIELYLKQPRFLWQFSVNNYTYFSSFFIKQDDYCVSSNVSCEKLLTYDQDNSGMVSPYNPSIFKHRNSKNCKNLNYTKLLKGVDLYKLYSYEESEWMFTSEYIAFSKNQKITTYHDFLNYLMLPRKT